MTAITKLCWDRIPDTANSTIALWPSPVGSDACFLAAGFEDFADQDEQWDFEWKRILFNCIYHLWHFGDASCNMKLAPDTSWPDKLRALLSRQPVDMHAVSDPALLVEKIFLVSSDDRLGMLQVEFGTPPIAAIRAGHGHPLLFVQFQERSDAEIDLMHQAAGGLPLQQVSLKWATLL